MIKHTFNKLHEKISKKSNVYDDTSFTGSSYNSGSDYVTDKQELSAYEKIVWFAACNDAISKDATSTGFHFVRTGTNEILEYRNIPEAISMPIEAGFNKLNFNKMLNVAIGHKKLTGNAYFFKAQTTAFGEIRGIADKFYPLNPAWVKINVARNGLELIGYEITLDDGTRFNIPPDRMIHFIQNPMFNPNVGVGNVTKARLVAENETQGDEYVNEFMNRKASPSLAITDETGRHPDDIGRLTDILQKKYEGKKNAGKILYMSGKGISITPITLSQKDMQFLELKVFNRQAILSINGVPGVRLAIPDGSNKAIAQVMTITYFDKTINPEITDMEETLNSQFIHPIDKSISIKFKRHHVGDVDQISKMISNGIITPNRASQMVGEEVTDSDERNQYYLTGTLIPMNLAGSQLMQFGGDESDKKPKVTNKAIDLTNPKNIDAILDHFEKSATRTKRFQKKYLKRSLEDRNAVEDKYVGDLSSFFSRSLERILKNIRDNETLLKSTPLLHKKELVKNDLLIIYNANSDNTDLAATAKRMHTSGVQRSVSGLNAVMKQNVSFSINNPFIKAAIGRLGHKIKRINDSTKKAVEQVLLKEINNGGNVVTLTKALQDKFDDFQGYRARSIARTEARMAWDAGAEVMYKEAGVKTVDIVGCTEFEINYDCGKQDVSINLLSTLIFHPNHIGAPAPSENPNG